MLIRCKNQIQLPIFRVESNQRIVFYMTKILNVDGLGKTYVSGSRALTVLDDISFAIEEGETFAIVGPSGSGKTTLLGLCAGLDQPDRGYVELCETRLSDLNEDQLALLRNREVGFIFQNFQLLPTLTALENVVVPIELQGVKNPTKIGMDLLAKVGLEERFHHYPSQLSGGEQQRVALARAFSSKPSILFADEPTGNLDSKNAENVFDIFKDLTISQDLSLLVVTHDKDFADRTDRIIEMGDGSIINGHHSSVMTAT